MQNEILMSQDDAKNFLNEIFVTRKSANITDTVDPFIVTFFSDGTVDIIMLSESKESWEKKSQSKLMDILSYSFKEKKYIVSIGIVAENIVAKVNKESDVALVQQWKNITGSLQDCPYVKIEETMSLFFLNTFNEYYDYVFIDAKNHDGLVNSVEASPHTSIEGTVFDILQSLKKTTLNIYCNIAKRIGDS